MTPGTFRANAPPPDPDAMQHDLSRIAGVGEASVVVDEEGNLQEIHLVCTTERSAKLVGRDVQSLLAARWGLDIDHRKISVVQLSEEEAPSPPSTAAAPAAAPVAAGAAATAPSPAVPGQAGPPATFDDVDAVHIAHAAHIERLSVSSGGDVSESSVVITIADRRAEGVAEGMASWNGQRRLVAQATLGSLQELDTRLVGYSIADVAAVTVGAQEVVITTLTGWSRGAEMNIVGAAVIGPAGELRAIAQSVLQAFCHID